MKDFKTKILAFLKKEKIPVLYFKDAQSEDLVFEQKAELAMKVDENDVPKWSYFTERMNCCGKVAGMAYFDGILKFVFEGTNDEREEGLLDCGLESFYNALQKRYFTVCPKLKSFSVLIKPTHRCNLDCKYCYDKPYREKIKEDMSMEVLDRTLKILSGYAQEVNIIWHGGEPTMVGTEWYKNAYENIFPKYPMTSFKFNLMSNGVDFNDEWLDLFKKYNIEAGISYNSSYQSQLRCSNQKIKSKSKDFKIMQKIEDTLIKAKKDKFKIGVIDVITSLNYKDQIKIYEYYKNLGIHVSMNHIFHTPQAERNKLEISAQEYAEEFLKYFRYWLFDKDGVPERSAEEALATVIGSGRVTCKHNDCRYKWLGINPLGEIYPCDRYYPEEYKAGTVFDFDSIEDIFNSQAYKTYADEVQRRFDTRCRECGYWFACKGGCNGSAFESSGSMEGVEEFFCESFRLKYNGIYDILRNLDWIDNKELNPAARRIFIEKPFYSAKEINQFMEDGGKQFELTYDKNNLLGCSEHQVFKGVNYMYDNHNFGMHVDFIDSFDEDTVSINKGKRRKNLADYLKKVAVYTLKSGMGSCREVKGC